jgi:hypothetical protein
MRISITIMTLDPWTSTSLRWLSGNHPRFPLLICVIMLPIPLAIGPKIICEGVGTRKDLLLFIRYSVYRIKDLSPWLIHSLQH